MRSFLLLFIGFPLLHISSFGGDTKAKTEPASSSLPAAPQYWDANSWEKGASIAFWRACPKNKSAITSTVIKSIKPADDRKADRKHSSPVKGG